MTKRKKELLFGSVITSISRGIQLTAAQLEECLTTEKTNYRYLSLADIDTELSLTLDVSKLRYFDPSKLDKKFSAFCARRNMILLTKNDTPYKVTFCGDMQGENVIVGGNIYMITVDDSKVLPLWMCAWLSSDEGMERLRDASSCTSVGKMKWISIRQIREMAVPNMSFQQQADFLMQIIRDYTDRINELQRRFYHIARDCIETFRALGIDIPSNDE